MCCGDPNICCNEVCEPATCSLSAGSDTVCPGKSIDIQGVAICNPDCVSMAIRAEVIEPEYQACVAVSVAPGSLACGPWKSPFTLTASVSPDASLGVVTVRLTGRVTGPGGAVICESTTDAIVTVELSATLAADPTTIPAASQWQTILPYAGSNITVTWEPVECEGVLQIVDLVGDGGYVPPTGRGSVERLEPTKWLYRAFLERQTELCPKGVNVKIAAKQGDTELNRVSVRVLPIHEWWTNAHQHGAGGQQHPPDQNDFYWDLDYLLWKYGGVLATTGGEASYRVSVDTCVWCPFPPCVWACTTWLLQGGYEIFFGTWAFTGSENRAASIIGHELVHTTGAAECPAYRWEADHCDATGVCPCDAGEDGYLGNVLDYLRDHSCP